MDKYLIINAGSSSLKFRLYDELENVIAKGNVERIGSTNSFYNIKCNDAKITNEMYFKTHLEAVEKVLEELKDNKIINDFNEIKGIGNRILHGGSLYKDSVLITEKVLKDIEDLTPLGPLHHPGEIAAIKCLQKLLPNTKQVAVFDTAFHQTMPEENFLYPVPYEWYTKYEVRKYGFHGTSHKYITNTMKEILNKENPNLIICHIGSGASLSCIKEGKCFNTTMGLTPLDGIMMGTRSGSIDPSILEYIHRCTNETFDEINNDLNKKSGLLGISGFNDYRDVEKLKEDNDYKGNIAYKMFINRIVDDIVIYYNQLKGNIDGIVFTAGIGENSYKFRKNVIKELEILNIELDDKINESIPGEIESGLITKPNSKVKVFVIPTDEEKMILLDTMNIVNKN